MRTPLLIALPGFAMLAACGSDGACGSVTTALTPPEGVGGNLVATGDAQTDTKDLTTSWVNFNGDVSIGLGSEIGEGPFFALEGLDESSGTQCAGAARLVVEDTEYWNGTDEEADIEAGGRPIAVDMMIDGDLVTGTFSGSFDEDAAGNPAVIDVEGAFRIDRSVGF